MDVFSDTHSPYALNSFQCTVHMKSKPCENPIFRFIHYITFLDRFERINESIPNSKISVFQYYNYKVLFYVYGRRWHDKKNPDWP